MSTAPQPGNVIPFPDKLRITAQSLPAGDSGIAKTIHAMRMLAESSEGAQHPAIRVLALQIVKGTPARDDHAQAAAIFDYVKANIEFRGEFEETLQTPLVTLQLGAGDCDDQATLVYALLRAIGIHAEFITVALDPTDPDRQFSHVYTSAHIRSTGTWLPLDTTVAASYPGWQPERITRIRAWGMGDTMNPTVSQALQTFDPLIQAAQQRIAYGNNPNATGYVTLPGGQRISYGGGIVLTPSVVVCGTIALAAAWWGLFGSHRKGGHR